MTLTIAVYLRQQEKIETLKVIAADEELDSAEALVSELSKKSSTLGFTKRAVKDGDDVLHTGYPELAGEAMYKISIGHL